MRHILWGGASALPTTELLRSVAGIPGVGALITVLYQAVRDRAAHERQLEIEERRQSFTIGVASHMANTAFDKHVELCEEYIRTMQRGLERLFRDGPTKDALRIGSELADVRLKFRAWVTPEVQDQLMAFERGLVEIGSTHVILEGVPVGDKRSEMVEAMYRKFSAVAGLPAQESVDAELAPGRIIGHLQELLGVLHLARLRATAVQQAIQALEKGS
jgi:hypothetical protein